MVFCAYWSKKAAWKLIFFFNRPNTRQASGTVGTNCLGLFCPIEVKRESQALRSHSPHRQREEFAQVDLLFPYLRLHICPIKPKVL